jgi:hypothetical protein
MWLSAGSSGESLVRQSEFVFLVSDKITYNVFEFEILFRHLTQRGKAMVRGGNSLAFLSTQLSAHMRFRRRNRWFVNWNLFLVLDIITYNVKMDWAFLII